MSEYGPSIDSDDVEDAVKATLKLWIHDYLGERERRSPHWNVGQITRPKSWQLVTDYRLAKADRRLPCIAVEAVEEEDEPGAGGSVHGSWGLLVHVIAKDNDREGTRRMVAAYVGAIKRILGQKGSLGGFATGVDIGATSRDTVGAEKAKTVAGATIRILVMVPDVSSRWGGPDEPTPPTVPPPSTSPEDPAHTSTGVNVSADL